MTYGVIRKPIIGGVTTGHNPAHEAMESRFDDEFVIPRPSTGVVSGKDKNVVLDAIAAAAAEPKGARIRISGGAFDIGDLDISIPKYAGTGKVLQFKGSGFIATTIKRSVDSGPGTWFIKGDSLDTDLYFAIFEDISFAGPGVSGAIGVAPCAMDGVKVGSRMKFNRCHFGLWNRALWLDGNHIEISSSEIHDNYRAIYFGQQYGLSGDVQIYNVAMDGQKRSNFGVANYSIATFHMRSGHLGLCPYNMEFDAGVSGHLSLGGALFDNVSVEQTGNSYFYSSDSSARVSGVTFRRCGNWSRLHASYGLPGVTANPGIKVAEWLGVTFEGGMPTLTTVGVGGGGGGGGGGARAAGGGGGGGLLRRRCRRWAGVVHRCSSAVGRTGRGIVADRVSRQAARRGGRHCGPGSRVRHLQQGPTVGLLRSGQGRAGRRGPQQRRRRIGRACRRDRPGPQRARPV
jgi:hypothetical protein